MVACMLNIRKFCTQLNFLELNLQKYWSVSGFHHKFIKMVNFNRKDTVMTYYVYIYIKGIVLNRILFHNWPTLIITLNFNLFYRMYLNY